ncbi:hypothetical protein CVT24_003843 [Panaeolus cyanescens]|uniref:Secreted protein n=1 Tax=Panaeolus cyanescens TaxID=181874 RepID=A0A409WC77_9AGAR|nr:hypothetical protein CVT24_003843 [Panaeolus cyanescens]
MKFQTLLSSLITLSVFVISARAFEYDQFAARQYLDDPVHLSARDEFITGLTTRELVAELEARLVRRDPPATPGTEAIPTGDASAAPASADPQMAGTSPPGSPPPPPPNSPVIGGQHLHHKLASVALDHVHDKLHAGLEKSAQRHHHHT